MVNKVNGFLFAALLIAMAGLIAFSGCSNNSPLSSDDENSDLNAINAVDAVKNLNPLDHRLLAKGDPETYLIDSAAVSHEFDDDGFEMTLSLDRKTIKFIVPEDAIDDDDKDIIILGEKWQTPDGIVYYYTCSPSGLVFEKPITLKQTLENTNYNEDMYWYNPASLSWEVEDSDKVVNGIVTFDIDHFSRYAISD
ncbi:MAG: hypothetical protein J7K40_03055 [candidate division Zixibacteria bacterium]|nr:hypothetical protein [candidate division Zixibacteria bacterium]